MVLNPGSTSDLQKSLSHIISEVNIPEKSKLALGDNLRGVNQTPQREILKAVLKAIGVELGV